MSGAWLIVARENFKIFSGTADQIFLPGGLACFPYTHIKEKLNSFFSKTSPLN